MIDPRALVTATLLLPGLLACNGRSDAEPTADVATPAEAPPSAPGAAGSPDAPARAADEVCLQGGAFTARGPLPVEPKGADGTLEIAGLRWESYAGCERFVVDLARADGGPAGAPGPVGVELMRGLGLVRIRLDAAETVESAATDSRFDGPLARAAYVVRPPGGKGMFVDLHLSEPAEARALLLTDPARVVVDLRPGGSELPPPAPTSRRVVIVEPRPGAASYPLTVRGYARTFEANVVARLEASGETAARQVTTATGWADAWGHFSLTLPDGPVGRVRLRVGEYSARDGSWEGVSVELDMR